jgi:hypothetical protein
VENVSVDNGATPQTDSAPEADSTFAVSAPQISLPKDGGAILGIDETFAANPVTGTGTLTVPIATAPGRSGFGPQLSLAYDSGSGDGPFGFGWRLSVPSTARATSGFTLTANPSKVAVLEQGGTVTPVIAISSHFASGFNSAIALSASGLPSGVTATFSPSSIAAPGSNSSIPKLTFSGALGGDYVITVSGSGGGESASIPVSLEVFFVATVVSLKVRAAQAANLCFSVDGILQEMDTQLGSTVNAHDFATFYRSLGTVAPTPSDNSLLQFNSANIYAAVGKYRLAALRAEPIKAALDSAILSPGIDSRTSSASCATSRCRLPKNSMCTSSSTTMAPESASSSFHVDRHRRVDPR